MWRSALFWKIIKFIFCNAPFFDKLVNLVLWVECIIKIGTCIFHCIIYGCTNLDKRMLWCEDASKLHIYGLICFSRCIPIRVAIKRGSMPNSIITSFEMWNVPIFHTMGFTKLIIIILPDDLRPLNLFVNL